VYPQASVLVLVRMVLVQVLVPMLVELAVSASASALVLAAEPTQAAQTPVVRIRAVQILEEPIPVVELSVAELLVEAQRPAVVSNQALV
jgi:TPP-dependent indolepyruvate ferredoxin oxidoreductase alpha subunit